jgi:hypothetical protein
MHRLNVLEGGLARFDLDEISTLSDSCRPRVLIVTESSLDFMAKTALGLSRFLHGILVGSGVTNKPFITLAYRNDKHPEKKVTINGDEFEVNCSFNFATAIPHVSTAEYDQIWLFGFLGNTSSLSTEEIAVISEFMNNGGGVFAVGDHEDLGLAMCGSLPRIRHMRDWQHKPIGNESVATAIERIDTVVNPGENNQFEFNDQSDDIPQRIYPKYKVVPVVGSVGWTATVHPLLGPKGDRTTPADFQKDIDVLPDHPHESVCLEVTPATTLLCEGKVIKVIEGKYKIGGGQCFVEFPFSACEPSKRVEAEIVAFAVSGGRAIEEGRLKPPVRPQMFGVISAYDGHDAQPYEAGGPNPGRIVCDSSWHHFVNINLDGTTSGRDGLGKWSHSTNPDDCIFTPSPELERIFGYYRNIIDWLMPPNRVVCGFWLILVAARYHPYLLEELTKASEMETWREFVGLGLEAAKVINLSLGSQTLRDKTMGVLRSERSEGAMKLMNLLDGTGAVHAFIDPDELLYGIVGCLLARTAVALPEHDFLKTALDGLKTGAEKMIMKLMDEVTPLLQSAINEQVNLAEDALNAVREMLVKLV